MEGLSGSARAEGQRPCCQARFFLLSPRSHRSARKCRKVHGPPLATAEPGGALIFLVLLEEVGVPFHRAASVSSSAHRAGGRAQSAAEGARSRGKPAGTHFFRSSLSPWENTRNSSHCERTQAITSPTHYILGILQTRSCQGRVGWRCQGCLAGSEALNQLFQSGRGHSRSHLGDKREVLSEGLRGTP